MDGVQIEGFDRKEYNAVILAALLHDIGKFLHRRDNQVYKVSHQETGASFIKEIGDKLRRDQLYDIELIEFLVRHHHSTLTVARSDAYLKESKTTAERLWGLLRIVKDADSYSCSERDQDEEERKAFADRHEPLKPIFLNITLGDAEKAENENDRYHLNCLNPFLTFPDEFGMLKTEEISGFVDKFKQNTPDISTYQKFDDVLNKWVDMLQRYTWAVPSDTRYKGPDVSLYDHLRSSAAFAACLYKRHIASINTGRNFERGNELILIGGDYSGIQDYIFDITNRGSGGAAKRLRARSFFIHLFSETTIHKILHTLDLPFVCNLFSSGGKFLLLAPNNDFTNMSRTLNQVKFDIEREISNTYFNQFSFLLSWMKINGYKSNNEFKISSFYQSADAMFHRLETEKLRKFRSILANKSSVGAHWNIDAFKANDMYQKYEGVGDCKICGRGPGIKKDSDPDTGEITNTCPICYQDKYRIGEKLPKANYVAFGKGVPDEKKEGERIFIFQPVINEGDNFSEGYYIELLKEYRDDPEHYLVCYVDEQDTGFDQNLSKPILLMHCASHVPRSVLDATKIASFEDIARRSRWKKGKENYGSDLLGVLKADIDNLGMIFSRGFIRPGKDEQDINDVDRRTVSRFLTLSRMTDLFFSGWINTVMTAPKEEIVKQLLTIKGVDADIFCKYLNNDSIYFNNIYTVYSGGDDLVLVGPWETMIIFSIFLNMQFRRYSCKNDHVTLSAGLAFIKEKHPIASAIRQADELLETSKKNGKDSITLFGTTIKWEKLTDLVNFFLFLDRKLNQEEPEINTAFLHRLLEYHNMAVDFIDNHNLEGLKYVSALSYDLGRNVVKWDKDGKITKGRETYDFLTERIINRKPEKGSAPIYNLKVPLFWALYRNRKAQIEED